MMNHGGWMDGRREVDLDARQRTGNRLLVVLIQRVSRK